MTAFPPPTGAPLPDPRYVWSRARLRARYARNVTTAKSAKAHVARFDKLVADGGCPRCFASVAEPCVNAVGDAVSYRHHER